MLAESDPSLMSAILQPYPGIRPFEERDWPIFFGRDTQSNDLLHNLETRRFVAVVGSSGSGKSSLVKAGLIPLIRQAFLRNVSDWATILCRPGADPFLNLASEIARLDHLPAAPTSHAFDAVSLALLKAELRASRLGIIPALERMQLPATRHFL